MLKNIVPKHALTFRILIINLTRQKINNINPKELLNYPNRTLEGRLFNVRTIKQTSQKYHIYSVQESFFNVEKNSIQACINVSYQEHPK